MGAERASGGRDGKAEHKVDEEADEDVVEAGMTGEENDMSEKERRREGERGD